MLSRSEAGRPSRASRTRWARASTKAGRVCHGPATRVGTGRGKRLSRLLQGPRIAAHDHVRVLGGHDEGHDLLGALGCQVRESVGDPGLGVAHADFDAVRAVAVGVEARFEGGGLLAGEAGEGGAADEADSVAAFRRRRPGDMGRPPRTRARYSGTSSGEEGVPKLMSRTPVRPREGVIVRPSRWPSRRGRTPQGGRGHQDRSGAGRRGRG